MHINSQISKKKKYLLAFGLKKKIWYQIRYKICNYYKNYGKQKYKALFF